MFTTNIPYFQALFTNPYFALNQKFECATSAFADEKKGEKIVMIFTGDYEGKELKSLLLKAEINPLMIPSNFLHVKEIPKLGTGKNDFGAIKKVTQESLK